MDLRFVLIAAVAVVFAVFLFTADRNKENVVPDLVPQEKISENKLETKSDEQGPVTVKVTPRLADKEWRFDVVLDTHSGDLDQDLLAVVDLADDRGVVYKPASWEGPGPGGHHRSGMLIFNTINSNSSFIVIYIKNIGGISERSFRWELK